VGKIGKDNGSEIRKRRRRRRERRILIRTVLC
jgi:hypothetical protein